MSSQQKGGKDYKKKKTCEEGKLEGFQRWCLFLVKAIYLNEVKCNRHFPSPLPLSLLSVFDAINSTAGPAHQHQIILWENTQGNIPWPWKRDWEKDRDGTMRSEAVKRCVTGKIKIWWERGGWKKRGREAENEWRSKNRFQDQIDDFTLYPRATGHCKHFEHAAWKDWNCLHLWSVIVQFRNVLTVLFSWKPVANLLAPTLSLVVDWWPHGGSRTPQEATGQTAYFITT